MNTKDSSVFTALKGLFSRVPSRVKDYVKENWGAPFILGFMALLMVAAASLIMEFSVFAEEVAVYAYYSLVVGVVFQLACFLKCRKGVGESSK